MRIQLLGPILIDGERADLARRDRIVLTRLALAPGEVVRRDDLAAALWGEDVPPSADKVVQGAVVRLRRRLGADTIETVPSGYRIRLSVADVDVTQFRNLVRRARELAEAGSNDRASHFYERALDLWRSTDLAELDEAGIDPSQQLQLNEIRLATEEDHLEVRLALRGGADLVESGLALVAADPHRERRWGLLALAQYRVGRQADGLRTIQRARTTLRSAVGLDLGRQIVELEHLILQQDPSLDVTVSSIDDGDEHSETTSPYRGLLAFGVDDRDGFFGRERIVADALSRLERTSSLLIVGPSGSGKSSVLRAGVVAALRSSGRPAAIVEPGVGIDLVQLRSLPKDTIVAVDQFEEFVANPQHSEAMAEFEQRFRRGSLIATMRSDGLDRLNEVPWLAELAERSLLVLQPLGADELRSVIIGPAASTGVRLEPGLVELMLRDVSGEPGALPLLSHALHATWLSREGRTMSVDGYQQRGGLHGAIARTANEVYETLDDTGRERMRSLMVRLFTTTPFGRPTRTRIRFADVHREGPDRDLVDRLSSARLIVVSDDGITVAHEALATAWPRLADWLDEDNLETQRRRHLMETAYEWDGMGRPDAELYSGARLAAALERHRQNGDVLSAMESDFLLASEARSERERAQAAHELDQRTRSNIRLRRLSAVMVAMALVLAGVGAVAVSRSRDAEVSRRRAEDATRAEARRALILEADSVRGSRRDLAALLAVEAHRLSSDIESRSLLFRTFTSSPGFLGYRWMEDGPAVPVDVAPVSVDTVAVLDEDLAVWLVPFDPSNGASTRLAVGAGPGTGLIAVARDGSAVAVLRNPVDGSATVDLVDVTARRPALSFPVSGGRTSIAIDTESGFVALAGGRSGGVELHAIDDGRLVTTIATAGLGDSSNQTFSAAVTFGSADELFVSTLSGAVEIRTTPDLELIDLLPAAPNAAAPTAGLVLADDGLALYGYGYTQGMVAPGSQVTRWDLSTSTRKWTTATRSECLDIALAASNDMLFCSDQFGSLHRIDATTGDERGEIDIQQGRPSAIATSPDGHTIVAASSSSAAFALVDSTGGTPITTIDAGSTRYDTPITYSPDGEHLLGLAVAGSPNDRPELPFLLPDLIDVSSAAVTDPLSSMYSATWLGADTLAYIGANGTSGIYDVSTGDSLTVDDSALTSLVATTSLDSVGRRVLLWLTDGSTFYVDTATGRISRAPFPRGLPDSIDFSADGERLAAVIDGRLDVLDAATGRRLAGPLVGFDSVVAGSDFVAASDDAGVISMFDLATLRPRGESMTAGNGPVQEMELSADETTLLARGGDAVRIYDLSSRQLLGGAIPVPRADPDEGAALRPDGRQAAIAATDGVALWELDVARWISGACAMAGRNLTRAEWSEYIGDLAPYHDTCPG